MKHRVAFVSFTLLISALSLSAQDVPAAPLPTLLATASKVFISNTGDQDNADCLRAYSEFYAGVVAAKHLQPVLSPADADLILELHYTIQVGPAQARATIGGPPTEARQFRLSFIDPKTQAILWAVVETGNSAMFQSSRDKDLDAAIAALVDDLKKLTGPTPTAPQDPQPHAIK